MLTLYFCAFYAAMSVNEYLVHRFFMHSRFSSHVDHHAETNADMSIRCHRESLDGDMYRGTAFRWTTTAMIAAVALPQALLLARIFSVTRTTATTTTMLLALYQGSIWNTLHPAMHGMPAVSWKHGVPPLPIFPQRYINHLVRNHKRHHDTKGSKAFNVTLLGADYIFGTD